jgi:hypothetical protein
MLSSRAILSVKFTAAGPQAGRAVSGFLRYLHYRDQHEVGERAEGIDGLVRYVAYRDQASPQGRLFDARGIVGDRERKRLVGFVNRSLRSTEDTRRQRRAVYRMVLSPEDARGLDLKELTRSVMGQLAQDAGPAGLPPWVAAEHRNTAHPHVHIVMAAYRETSPGHSRGLVINRERLARMKLTMGRAIELQRGERSPSRSLTSTLLEAARPQARQRETVGPSRDRRDSSRSRRQPVHFRPLGFVRVLRRLAYRNRLAAERLALELEWERERDRERGRGRGGWER